MGGYGGLSGKLRRQKDGCYYDSQKDKVTEKSSIMAAEYYLKMGMSVVFLHEKKNDGEYRPDLLVDYKFLVEVKALTSLSPSGISKRIIHASEQIESENSRRPNDKQLPGKIVIISLHENFEAGFKAVYEGYQEAKRKNKVHFQVEFWFNEEIHVLE